MFKERRLLFRYGTNAEITFTIATYLQRKIFVKRSDLYITKSLYNV